MAWTTPAVRSTGDLVTAAIWNTDIGDNIKYLKGQAGAISLESDVLPSAYGTKDLGSVAYPWAEAHALTGYVGNQFCLHKGIREQLNVWEDDTSTNYQLDIGTGGAGADFALGGTGQSRLKVTGNQVGTVYVANPAEQNNAFDMSFNASRNPYLRMEWTVPTLLGSSVFFLGWRTTRNGTAKPNAAAESYAGLLYEVVLGIPYFEFVTGNGAGTGHVSSNIGLVFAVRNVIEILIIGGSQVVFFLNGVYYVDWATALPTGDLDWQALFVSDGSGGGIPQYLTLGNIYAQEDLS